MSTSDPTPTHTLGPACRLAPVPEPEPPTASLYGIPPIRAQFFYSSPIPIDDPLAAATIIGSSDPNKPTKLPLRPLSAADNAALERAWLGFASDRARRNHTQAARNRSPSPALSKENAEKLAAIVALLAGKHKEKHEREGSAVAQDGANPKTPEHGGVSVCCAELALDASAELRREFCAVTRRRQQSLDHDRVLEAVMTQLARMRAVDMEGAVLPEAVAGLPLPLGTSPAQGIPVGSVGLRPSMASVEGGTASSLPGGSYIPARPPVLDDGISGKPFVRVEATPRSNRSSTVGTPDERAGRGTARGRIRGDSRASARPALNRLEDSVEIPVGISRLHMISLPVLQMKPIYWSPVNDIATVLRATWFYR